MGYLRGKLSKVRSGQCIFIGRRQEHIPFCSSQWFFGTPRYIIRNSESESYMQDSPAILFVYNLDSAVLQSVHEYTTGKGALAGEEVSPLSRLTHSPLGIKKEWKRFIKDLPMASRSMTRDEFIMEFGNISLSFPVIIYKKGATLSVLIATEEIRACREIGDLIHLVKSRILDL